MDANSSPKGTPTVSRVHRDTVVELVYDAEMRQTALAVGHDGTWRIEPKLTLETGEFLIPYAPSNNLIRHECVKLPSRPIEHGGRAALLADIEAYLHRYIDLSPEFERIAAHYVLLSWVFDAFNELPYLRFQGAFGSGKTRALIAVGSIVYKGFFASGASTVSPIFHTLDAFGGTLILDEADFRFSDKTSDLVKILNNGTVRGLPVLRSVQNRDKVFNPAAFQVYGPKIVAMRGAFRDLALESRFLTEPMGKGPLRSDIPIQLPDQLAKDALQLRNRLLYFRLTNLFTLEKTATRIADIDPRLNQTAASLLALIDDDRTREDLLGRLHETQQRFSMERERSIEARTRNAVSDAFADSDRPYIPLQEIARRANADGADGVASARDIGRALRAMNVTLHKSHGTIVVPRTALETLAAG